MDMIRYPSQRHEATFSSSQCAHSNRVLLRSTEVTEAWMKKAARDYYFFNDPAEKTTPTDIDALSSGFSTNQTFLAGIFDSVEPHKICVSARTWYIVNISGLCFIT